MKVVTVGRGDDCDVVVVDSQNLISRRHALLRIYPFGKMELVPLGRNGTFLNGLPLRNDKPKVVTRKDVISFAHVKQLDWALVKDPYRIYRIGTLGLFAIIVLLLGTFVAMNYMPSQKNIPFVDEPFEAVTDTIKQNTDTTGAAKDTIIIHKPVTTPKPTPKKKEVEAKDEVEKKDSESTSLDQKSEENVDGSKPIVIM